LELNPRLVFALAGAVLGGMRDAGTK
jgi:hypothetical protein